MINYEFLILLGIFSFVYSNLLTEPNMILSGWYKWLNKVFKTDKRNEEGKGYHWLFMILIHCEKCIAGQLALWFTLIENWFDMTNNNNPALIVNILLSITFTILVTSIIKNLYNKIL